MSCEYVTEHFGVCIRPAEWQVEGNDAEPFELDVPSTHCRKVCGDVYHLVDTIREFTDQGVTPVLVSAYVQPLPQSGGTS